MKNENTELALIEDISESNAPAIYGHSKLDQFYDAVKEKVTGEVPDLSTDKGRKRIASLAAKVSTSKKAVENPGRDYLKRLKDLPKTIEKELREFVDKMDALRDEVRKPLTDWEDAEQARVDGHKATIGRITLFRQQQYFQSGNIEEAIDSLNSIFIDDSMQEFELEATREHKHSLEFLSQLLIDMQKREAEQAELERLRKEAAEREQKEREERIAREAAENARIAAEQAAAAERQRLAVEQARKDSEAKAAIERAEREKVEAENARLRQEQQAREAAEKAEQDRLSAIAKAEAEKQAAIEEERKRQADAIEAERLSAEQREKDRANVGRKRKEAKEALMSECGISEEVAKAVVLAIAGGKIANVSIEY